MYKKYLVIAAVLISASFLAACSGDSNSGGSPSSNPSNPSNNVPATGNGSGVVTKSTAGCRGCHGVSTFRTLPTSHASYTTGDAQCLGCHKHGSYVKGAAIPYIHHALGATTGSTTDTSSGGTATTDGASLYTTYCAGCHGAKASTTVDNKTVAAAQAAIAATTYGMNTTTLKALTTDQLTAISTYLSN